MYTSPPMKKHLISTTVALGTLLTAPSAFAYSSANPLLNPLYGPKDYIGAEPIANHKDYYGTPEIGVKLLRNDARNSLLQNLEQRVMNLQKTRKAPAISPNYSVQQGVYERLLRRVGNQGLEHYRAPEALQYQLMWKDGKLTKVPVMTPDDIRQKVNALEEDRALRFSSDDCTQYSGARQAICRYQRRARG